VLNEEAYLSSFHPKKKMILALQVLNVMKFFHMDFLVVSVSMIIVVAIFRIYSYDCALQY
jgi:hypothetical protein